MQQVYVGWNCSDWPWMRSIARDSMAALACLRQRSGPQARGDAGVLDMASSLDSGRRMAPQGLTTYLLNETLCIESTADRMDAGSQPIQQKLNITCFDVLLRGTNLSSHRLTQLSADEMAQQIGGEIAKKSLRPMHILETTLRVIGWRHSKQLLVSRPFAGQILNRKSFLRQAISRSCGS